MYESMSTVISHLEFAYYCIYLADKQMQYQVWFLLCGVEIKTYQKVLDCFCDVYYTIAAVDRCFQSSFSCSW